VKLRARWLGPVPRVGDYLASTTRPRFAYCIRGVRCVDSLVRWDPAQKKELRRLAIEVDRVPIAELPPSVRVYDWRWDKRTSAKHLTR
jgi:hypothetical protein